MTREYWRAVNLDPAYEVSSQGRVRSLPRQVPCKKGTRSVPARILKNIVNGCGYEQVVLSRRKIFLVHRLVAMAFIENQLNLAQVNHINGIKTDNRTENLEWASGSDNIRHSFRVLGRTSPTIGKFGGDHGKSIPVASYKDGNLVKEYRSAMDAVREGFDSSSISRCCAGKIRHHKGLQWVKI